MYSGFHSLQKVYFIFNKQFPKESEESPSELEGSESLFLSFEKTSPKWLIKKNGGAYNPEKSLTKRDLL